MHIQTLSDLCSSYVPEAPNFVQVVIEYSYTWLCMHVQGSSVEIQIPAHLDPLCCRSEAFPRRLRLTALPVPQFKSRRAFQKDIIISCYYFVRRLSVKLRNVKLRKSGRVST